MLIILLLHTWTLILVHTCMPITTVLLYITLASTHALVHCHEFAAGRCVCVWLWTLSFTLLDSSFEDTHDLSFEGALVLDIHYVIQPDLGSEQLAVTSGNYEIGFIWRRRGYMYISFLVFSCFRLNWGILKCYRLGSEWLWPSLRWASYTGRRWLSLTYWTWGIGEKLLVCSLWVNNSTRKLKSA